MLLTGDMTLLLMFIICYDANKLTDIDPQHLYLHPLSKYFEHVVVSFSLNLLKFFFLLHQMNPIYHDTYKLHTESRRRK